MKGPKGEELRIRSKWEQSESGDESGRLSYRNVDAETMREAVEVLTADGDAITFGITSDGGAFMVAVLSQGKVFKSYFDSPESLEMRLRALKAVAMD